MDLRMHGSNGLMACNMRMLDNRLHAHTQAFEALCLIPCDAQGRPITWQDSAALDNYMSRLESAQRALVDKNVALRAQHKHIGERLAALAQIDLTAHRERWLQGVEGVRGVFVKCEEEFPRHLQVCLRTEP